MKCPVCKKYLLDGSTSCPNCGFSNVRTEFINIEEANEWLKTVASYRKNMKSNERFMPHFRDGILESAQDLMQDYLKCSSQLEENPLDYKARNRLIDLLSSEYCEGTSYENESWEEDYEEEYANKIEAFKYLRDISGFYRQKRIGGDVQADRLQLWSILKDAQCSLCIGECFRALQSYNEALAHPIIVGAIRSMDREKWWTSEFSFDDAETILKIIYNMARILEWMGLDDKAANIYSKYSNIIKYKCDSVHRISLKDDLSANAKARMQRDADVLCGFSRGENFFYILKAHYLGSGRSLMDIGFEHPEEPFRIDLDEELNFQEDFGEVMFHDGIYPTGIARIKIDTDDFDMQRKKARMLI